MESSKRWFDYVHNHVVRAMMNGALGQEVINGTWNQGDVITKSINYTIPVPTAQGPDLVGTTAILLSWFINRAHH